TILRRMQLLPNLVYKRAVRTPSGWPYTVVEHNLARTVPCRQRIWTWLQSIETEQRLHPCNPDVGRIATSWGRSLRDVVAENTTLTVGWRGLPAWLASSENAPIAAISRTLGWQRMAGVPTPSDSTPRM